MPHSAFSASIIRRITSGITSVIAVSILVSISACTSSRLSSSETAKLDPLLQRLIAGDATVPLPTDVTTNADGGRTYGVIVRTTEPDLLRTAGFEVSSAMGDVAVVRATISEIVRLAQMEYVRSISIGSENQIH